MFTIIDCFLHSINFMINIKNHIKLINHLITLTLTKLITIKINDEHQIFLYRWKFLYGTIIIKFTKINYLE